MDVEHTAVRPSWDCRACRRPWPCATARDRLRAELTGTQLRIYAWTTLEEAVADLSGLPGPALFQRFMSWTGGVTDPS